MAEDEADAGENPRKGGVNTHTKRFPRIEEWILGLQSLNCGYVAECRGVKRKRGSERAVKREREQKCNQKKEGVGLKAKFEREMNG